MIKKYTLDEMVALAKLHGDEHTKALLAHEPSIDPDGFAQYKKVRDFAEEYGYVGFGSKGTNSEFFVSRADDEVELLDFDELFELAVKDLPQGVQEGITERNLTGEAIAGYIDSQKKYEGIEITHTVSDTSEDIFLLERTNE